MKKKYTDSILWEIEDLLHSANPPIFVNGLNNRPSEMCAYMTCMEYAALETFLQKHFKQYSKNIWQRCCRYWEHVSYLSPMPKLLASFITKTRLS